MVGGERRLPLGGVILPLLLLLLQLPLLLLLLLPSYDDDCIPSSVGELGRIESAVDLGLGVWLGVWLGLGLGAWLGLGLIFWLVECILLWGWGWVRGLPPVPTPAGPAGVEGGAPTTW